MDVRRESTTTKLNGKGFLSTFRLDGKTIYSKARRFKFFFYFYLLIYFSNTCLYIYSLNENKTKKERKKTNTITKQAG